MIENLVRKLLERRKTRWMGRNLLECSDPIVKRLVRHDELDFGRKARCRIVVRMMKSGDRLVDGRKITIATVMELRDFI